MWGPSDKSLTNEQGRLLDSDAIQLDTTRPLDWRSLAYWVACGALSDRSRVMPVTAKTTSSTPKQNALQA